MLVFAVIAALVVVLAIVLVVNAVRLKPTPVNDPLPQSSAMGTDDAVERFREILRSKTVWAAADPDADHTAFDKFVPKLRGLYPRVFEACELEIDRHPRHLASVEGRKPRARADRSHGAPRRGRGRPCGLDA